jgi:hypothetical protein
MWHQSRTKGMHESSVSMIARLCANGNPRIRPPRGYYPVDIYNGLLIRIVQQAWEMGAKPNPAPSRTAFEI